MKNIYTYTFLLLALLCSSCASTKYMNIDIFEPAFVNLDSTIVNVLVVNNIPNVYQPTKEYENDSDKYLAQINDSTKWNFVKLLAKYMDSENYFGNVSDYNYLIRRDTTFNNDIPLTKNQIIELCESTESDAIISLDKIGLSASVEKMINIDGYYTDILELNLAALIRTYTADGKILNPQIIAADSLFWEGSSTGRNVIEPLPELKNASSEMASHFADKVVDYYTPHWKTTTRFYYTGGKSEMKKADKAMQSNNWAEAEEYWTALYQQESDIVKKIQLSSNIALANECQNKMDDAKKWIDISFGLITETDNKIVVSRTMLYHEELERRIKNQKKLEEQLGTISVSNND